jgi:hypothetical protein
MMTDNHGRSQGEASELEVAIHLIGKDFRISQTFSHSHPYDLIVDVGGELLKIQVKTANSRGPGNQYQIEINDEQEYDFDNVDLFAGNAPDVEVNDGVFFVPYPEMEKRASVTFTPLEDMGADVNRERANHISQYTFEEALSRLKEYEVDNEE